MFIEGGKICSLFAEQFHVFHQGKVKEKENRAGAQCHAIYPPSRQAWIYQVQTLAVLWGRWTGRIRGFCVGLRGNAQN
jgi:hypothetical protein